MHAPLQTLSVIQRVGGSLVGTSDWGPRYEHVPLGRAVPSLRVTEDAESILRCGFLEKGSPFELNLLCSETIRGVLRQKLLTDPIGEGWLDPESVLRDHPSIGYIPPEVLSSPNPTGLGKLARSSLVGERVARLWLKEPPSAKSEVNWAKKRSEDLVSDQMFWRSAAKAGAYPLLIGDLLSRGQNVRLSLLAPPVPSIRDGFGQAATLQFELNNLAATLMAPAPGSATTVYPAYSFWVHPSAFAEPSNLHRAIDNLRVALGDTTHGFRAVHLSFYDLSAVAASGVTSIRAAKDLSAKVASIAEASGRFLIVSDTGPVGWTFLDRGAAFTSYPPSMVMRRTYPQLRAATATTKSAKKRVKEQKFGRVLGGPWNYVLLRLKDVRQQSWKLEELNGKFPNEVPYGVRRDPELYRTGFSKPYNIAVQETLNDARDSELMKRKNSRPGSSSIGKSDDPDISPWWS